MGKLEISTQGKQTQFFKHTSKIPTRTKDKKPYFSNTLSIQTRGSVIKLANTNKSNTSVELNSLLESVSEKLTEVITMKSDYIENSADKYRKRISTFQKHIELRETEIEELKTEIAKKNKLLNLIENQIFEYEDEREGLKTSSTRYNSLTERERASAVKYLSIKTEKDKLSDLKLRYQEDIIKFEIEIQKNEKRISSKTRIEKVERTAAKLFDDQIKFYEDTVSKIILLDKS